MQKSAPKRPQSSPDIRIFFRPLVGFNQLARKNPAMLDSTNSPTTDKQDSIDKDDALALARLPALVERLEETAYALVRKGDAINGRDMFVAVAAAQRAMNTQTADLNGDLELPSEFSGTQLPINK